MNSKWKIKGKQWLNVEEAEECQEWEEEAWPVEFVEEEDESVEYYSN